MESSRAESSEALVPLAFERGEAAHALATRRIAPLEATLRDVTPVNSVRPAVLDEAVGNVVESGSLRVALSIESVTKRFVFFRLTAAGSTRRLRCTVATMDPAQRNTATVLLQSALAPGDVLDAGFIVRRHLAGGVTAELSGSDVAVIVRAPESLSLEESPVRRTLDAVAGVARPWSIGAAAGFGVVAGAALIGFATFATLEHGAARTPQALATAAPQGALLAATSTFGPQAFQAGSTAAAALFAGPRGDGSGRAGSPFVGASRAGSSGAGSSGAGSLAAGLALTGTGGSRRTAGGDPSLPPLIGAASLEKPIVSGGAPIVIAYQVRKPSGEVRLIDDRGTVRAAALLTATGSSIVVAPQVDVEQDFRVVLNADDGDRHEERSLSVRVQPVPGPTAPATLDEERIATKTGRPFVLAQHAVTSGDGLWVTIVRHESDMRVTMLDQDGNEVASTKVDRNRTRVELKTPRGLFPEMYTVDVSYVDANGQEHSVTPILVR